MILLIWMKKITMEKFKKFKQENKDFLLPINLSPKEKDIFIYLFRHLREKINRGIYPEMYNDEITYTKSDMKSLFLKEILIYNKYKKGWVITINPHNITKNAECSFCGAKFNEMVYFRRNSIRCPGCGIRMHGLATAKRVNDYSVAITNIEKVEAIPKVTTSVVKVPIEHVITDVPGNLKITDIVLAPTAMERTKQIANQEVIPFQTSKADRLNAISELNRIAEKKKEKRTITTQEKILANFSDACVNFVKEYFCIYDHTIFSTMKYMNIGLSEITKDPRFIANASLKNNVISEVKTACELLCENADIRMLFPSTYNLHNEHVTALKLP